MDIITFCFNEDCSFETIGKNITKNMFVLVGKITSIIELLSVDNIDDSNKFFSNDSSIFG